MAYVECLGHEPPCLSHGDLPDLRAFFKVQFPLPLRLPPARPHRCVRPWRPGPDGGGPGGGRGALAESWRSPVTVSGPGTPGVPVPGIVEESGSEPPLLEVRRCAWGSARYFWRGLR